MIDGLNIEDRFSGLQTSALEFSKTCTPYLPAIFFAAGFVFDILTLGRIDNIFNIASHGAYLLATMFLLSVQIIGVKPGNNPGKIKSLFFDYQNEAVHFLLGALLNAFVIFYFKSGSFIKTFLLVIILLVLLIINEIEYFKRKGPALKVALFTISLSSFFIYLLPVAIGKTSGGIFLASLSCTGLVILLFWHLLLRYEVSFARLQAHLLLPGFAVIVLFVIFYAARIIPPVPLSLKQIGIYHNLERESGKFYLYRMTPLWKIWSHGDQEFAAREGDRIYLFSRIFAPGGFKDKLYFHFQMLDKKKQWRTTDKIPLIIVGGRDEGFRGYAYKANYTAGQWRALVETAEGLEIGRINFQVSMSAEPGQRTFYQEIY